jgi:hypothetical protein
MALTLRLRRVCCTFNVASLINFGMHRLINGLNWVLKDKLLARAFTLPIPVQIGAGS